MKNAVCISGIMFTTLLFVAIVIFGEVPFLDIYRPQLPSDTNIGQWLGSFEQWALACVLGAGVVSVLWYALAQWVFKIKRWADTDKRLIWSLFLLLPVVIVVISCFQVERTQSSLWWVYLIFLLNGLIPFYFATSLFSPPSFKYIPVGSKSLRSFW